MSGWVTLGIWIVGIIGSGMMNLLLISFYIGRYRAMVEEVRDSAEESRKSLVLVREDVARIKGRMNFKGWNKEI